MSILFIYASFPNSRIKPRSPTTLSQTFNVVAPVFGSVPIQIVAPDLNRTELEVSNVSVADDFFYFYTYDGVQDPTVTATFGKLNDLFFRTTTNVTYRKTADDGISTSWVIVPDINLDTVGFRVLALQAFGTTVNQMSVRAVSATASAVTLFVDNGRG